MSDTKLEQTEKRTLAFIVALSLMAWVAQAKLPTGCCIIISHPLTLSVRVIVGDFHPQRSSVCWPRKGADS